MTFMKNSRGQGDERLGRSRVVGATSSAERDSVQQLLALANRTEPDDAEFGDRGELISVRPDVTFEDAQGRPVDSGSVVHAIQQYLMDQIDRRPPTAA